MDVAIRNPKTNLIIGRNTVFGENVVLGPNCKQVEIGFGCYIGRDVYIDVEKLNIGDYTTIHHGAILHGIKTQIGHNCWIGHYTIIDSLGGDTFIGNGVGVGAHSQLWSHMKFGDVLAGCRWNSTGSLTLEDDVWLVGHCIAGPIHAKRKAMLMTGGVVTQDMKENHIYGGVPAAEISSKLGFQYSSISVDAKKGMFEKIKADYLQSTGKDVKKFISVESFSFSDEITEFDLSERKYYPRYSDDEYQFIKFMLYDRAKFVPVKKS